MTYRIMYIEEKSGIAALGANIGKVFLSKTGKTLTYKGRSFQSLKGAGYKANFFDVETGDRYWVSGCRKDGNDGLYQIKVLVDSEIRSEYWRDIRCLPDMQEKASFVSAGKHRAGGKEVKDKHSNFPG
ncbi:MAG: 1-deoxy-D-xylulose-5-phosphate synthase [Rhodobacteraceae bacterium]|nr:1-deoxy-D-xylulose-5-phosphate synthase [Paracoccaceae bacterium]